MFSKMIVFGFMFLLFVAASGAPAGSVTAKTTRNGLGIPQGPCFGGTCPAGEICIIGTCYQPYTTTAPITARTKAVKVSGQESAKTKTTRNGLGIPQGQCILGACPTGEVCVINTCYQPYPTAATITARPSAPAESGADKASGTTKTIRKGFGVPQGPCIGGACPTGEVCVINTCYQPYTTEPSVTARPLVDLESAKTKTTRNGLGIPQGQCILGACPTGEVCVINTCYQPYPTTATVAPPSDAKDSVDVKASDTTKTTRRGFGVPQGPCLGGACPTGEVCVIGTCYQPYTTAPSVTALPSVAADSGADKASDTTKTTRNGLGVPQGPCLGGACPTGEVCVIGTCYQPYSKAPSVASKEAEANKHPKKTTRSGFGTPQGPCSGGMCPPGEVCVVGTCYEPYSATTRAPRL